MLNLVSVLAWCRKYHDLVAAVLIVLATTLAFNIGKHCGAERAHEEDAAKAAEALKAADSKYREKETQHEKELSELRRSYAATAATAVAVDAAVTRDLGAGVKRLRFPIATRCPRPASPGAASAGVDAKEEAELAPEAAASLYRIAADGDEAIEQLIALQDWALSAVKLCNGGNKR